MNLTLHFFRPKVAVVQLLFLFSFLSNHSFTMLVVVRGSSALHSSIFMGIGSL